MPIALCPECGTEIHVDEDVDKGDQMVCEECDSPLEVVGLDPVELDLREEEDDGYEDDDDY